MAAQIYYSPFIPAFNGNGAPIPGAKLYFFLTGTNTLAPIFSDASLSTVLSNPVQSDLAAKFPNIYLDSTKVYRVRVTDPLGIPIGDDIDPYYPGQALVDIATLPQLVAPDGSTKVGYKAEDSATIARTVKDKLDSRAIDVTDYFSTAEKNDIHSGAVPVLNVSPKINLAFAFGRLRNKPIFLPAANYGIGDPLIYSTNVVYGLQASAPAGLIGESKSGAVLYGLSILTGTLLTSHNCAGNTFRDFHIYNQDSTAQPWDCSWLGDPGPSTQNVIKDVLVTGTKNIAGYPNTPQINWDNLNDTYPTDCTLRVPDDNVNRLGKGISVNQSGGLTMLRGCIWTGSYLNIGCQNGKLDTCWGHGIQLAFGATNTLHIDAGYLYPGKGTTGKTDPTKNAKAAIWSESFDSFQSTIALTITATQIIVYDGVNAVDAVMDINAGSIVKFQGNEFVANERAGGPYTYKMLGPNSRSDVFAPVLISLEGGRNTGNVVTFNDSADFRYEFDNHINTATGRPYTAAKSFFPIIGGVTTTGSGTYTTRSATYEQKGDIIEYQMRLVWSGHTGTGGLLVMNMPVSAAAQHAVTVGYAGSTWTGKSATAVLGGSIISFFDQNNAQIQMNTSGDIILSGTYRCVT